MNTKGLFKKYYRRVALQGLLKAFLLAAAVGFAADFFAAFVLWFVSPSAKVVLLGAAFTFLGAVLIALPVLYFLFFRPTTQKIAKLIDRLGLEERMITMVEMEQDESYIALLQREDAKEKLKKVSPRQMKFSLSRFTPIALAVSFVLAGAMVTVSALAANGIVRPGYEVFSPPDDEDKDEEEEEKKEYVTIDYLASEGGFVSGEAHQEIEKGKDADPVTATPLEGYVFVVWSDGILTEQRWDWSVMEDLEVEAIFELAPEGTGDGDTGKEGEGTEGEGGEEETEGDGGDEDGGDEGDQDGDGNGEDGSGDGQAPGEGDGQMGQGGPNGEGNTDDTEGNGDGESYGGEDGGGEGHGNTHEGQGAGPGSSPGKNTDNNNIIDGKTDYHDAVDTEKNKQDLAEDDSIPPALKDILDGYFDSLKP